VWASGAAVVANVAGNLLLVPRIGITGAAIASSVSYSILSAILIVYYLRVTGLSWTALVPRARDLAVYLALWRQILDSRLARTGSRA
jgi:O-antigen/teichoic acid export membrane protein